MNILIIGGGGREHALAWKVAQSPQADTVFVAPGNAGTALEAGIENVAIDASDIEALLAFALANTIGLTIVGPEIPLVAGIVDQFTAAGLRCFGPARGAAQLEGSKTFAKDFLARQHIPTAAYAAFTDIAAATDYIRAQGAPIVIKADGLAAGKGVILAQTEAEAIAAVADMLGGNVFGEALLSWWMASTACHWPRHRITRRVITVTAVRTPVAWVLTRRPRSSRRPFISG